MEVTLQNITGMITDCPKHSDESTMQASKNHKDDSSVQETVHSYHMGNPIGLKVPNISMRNLVFYRTDLIRGEVNGKVTSKIINFSESDQHTIGFNSISEKYIRHTRKHSEGFARNREYQLKSHFRKSSQPGQVTQQGQSRKRDISYSRPASFDPKVESHQRNESLENDLRVIKITKQEDCEPRPNFKLNLGSNERVKVQTLSVFQDYLSKEENFVSTKHILENSPTESSRVIGGPKKTKNRLTASVEERIDPRMMSLIGNFTPVNVSSDSWRKFQQAKSKAMVNPESSRSDHNKRPSRFNSSQKADYQPNCDMLSESVSSPMLERHESRNKSNRLQTPSILLKKSSQRSDSKHYRRTTPFGSQIKQRQAEASEHAVVREIQVLRRKDEEQDGASFASDKSRQPVLVKTNSSNSRADYYRVRQGGKNVANDRVTDDTAIRHLQHHKQVIGDMHSLRRKILKLVSERSALNLYSKKQRSKVDAEPQPLPERIEEPAFYEVKLGCNKEDQTEDNPLPQYFADTRIVKVIHQTQPKGSHLNAEARSRKKFMMNHQKIHQAHSQYELELQDDLIAQHANEGYMERLEFNLDNCLEVCKSLSNNLAFAAEICEWRKFMFQSFINESLNSIKSKLSIARHFNFVAEKKSLKASSKLRPSYYAACLFTDDPATWNTLFPILDGYFKSLDYLVTAKQLTDFLCSFGMSLELSLPVFLQLKQIDIQVSKFVIQRRMRNMTDDAEKILKQIQSIGEKDESYKFTIDRNFEQGKQIVAKMHEEVIQVGQIGKSLQQIMTETKRFTGVECKVPEGYQKLQTAGHDLLDRLRSVFKLKQENRRPTILLPVENKLGTVTDQPIFPEFD